VIWLDITQVLGLPARVFRDAGARADFVASAAAQIKAAKPPASA